MGPPPAPPPAPALNELAPLPMGLGRTPTALKAPAALLPAGMLLGGSGAGPAEKPLAAPTAAGAKGGGLPAADPGSAAKLGAPPAPWGWPTACGCHVGGASCALPGPGAAPPVALPPEEKGRAAKDALLLVLGLKPVLLPKDAPASGSGALEKDAGWALTVAGPGWKAPGWNGAPAPAGRKGGGRCGLEAPPAGPPAACQGCCMARKGGRCECVCCLRRCQCQWQVMTLHGAHTL